MVTLQILVLPFLVRIQVGQQKGSSFQGFLFLYLGGIRIFLVSVKSRRDRCKRSLRFPEKG